MPKYIGETEEEAIQRALDDMGVTRDEVTVRVVSKGKKGFLGLGKKEAEVLVEKKIPVADMGITVDEVPVESESEVTQDQEIPSEISTATDGAVSEEETRLAEKKDTETGCLENLDDDEALKELSLYLMRVTKEMGLPAMIRIEKEPEVIVFHLESSKQGMLIGKHGKILNALQYLAQVFIHRVAKNKLSIMVNVGNYREKREEIVKRLAKNTAEKVKRTGEQVVLEPMSAYERKQVHSLLAADPHIKTHSEGEEPYRYLIVEYEKSII